MVQNVQKSVKNITNYKKNKKKTKKQQQNIKHNSRADKKPFPVRIRTSKYSGKTNGF